MKYDFKKRSQHLLGECKPYICMESENLQPAWRVIV